MKKRSGYHERRGNQAKKYVSEEIEQRGDTPFKKPEENKLAQDSKFLVQSSYKKLKQTHPLTLYLEPDKTISYSGPYFILADNAKVFDAKYAGQLNLRGNSMDQIITEPDSDIFNIIDCARSQIYINYAYLNIDGKLENYINNLKMGQSIEQALAATEGQMFTDLKFFSRVISSPEETSEIVSGLSYSSMPQIDYNNYGLYLVWYQTILQNIAMIGAQINKFLSMEDLIKTVTYEHGSKIVSEFYSHFKKSTFISLAQSVVDSLNNNFFDTDWFNHIKTLTQVCSKKSMSMSDPLLSIVPVTKIPSILVQDENETTLVDNETMNIEYTSYSSYSGDTKERAIGSFQMICEKLLTLLDPVNIIGWVRRKHSNLLTSTEPSTTKQYYNTVAYLLEGMQDTLNKQFQSAVSPINTMLPVAGRAGLNNWVQGFKINISNRCPQYQPVYNKLVEDFFKSYLASSGKLTWNSKTSRWHFYTLWDSVTGINNFDNYSGGAFLTMSTRGFEYTDGESKTSTKYLLPMLFNPSSTDGDTRVIDQNGHQFILKYKQLNAELISNNHVLSRLNPLNKDDLIIRVPTIDAPQGYTVSNMSHTYRFLSNLFGIGCIGLSASDQTKVDYCCNSTALMYLDAEISTIVDQMITYYQTHSPFKVYTQGGGTLGFSKD